MATFNHPLPNMGGEPASMEEMREQLHQLKSYVFNLNNELRYVLSNIDKQNFAGGALPADTIPSTLTRTVEDLEGQSSTIQQTANNISLTVGNTRVWRAADEATLLSMLDAENISLAEDLLWYDTTNKVLKRYTGAAWEIAQTDELHTSYIDIANDSIIIGTGGTITLEASDQVEVGEDTLADLLSASSGSTIYYQATQPATAATGDLWYDTDAVPVSIWRYNGATWDDITEPALSAALTAAEDAQSTADGRIVCFAQAGIPTSTAIGDLWVDTDDNNKLYRAASEGADEIAAGEWELYRIAAGYLSTSYITVDNDSIDIVSGGAVNIASGGTVTIKSGGSGQGLVLKNASDTNVLVADASGNLDITGKITSSSGQIGGFAIGATTLSASPSGKPAVTLDAGNGKISIGNLSLTNVSTYYPQILAGGSYTLIIESNVGISIGNSGHGIIVVDSSGETVDINDPLYVEDVRVPRTDYGTAALTGVSWASVSFGFTFDAAPKVVCTYAQDAASSGIYPLKTKSVTTTGFQVCMAGSSGSGTRYVDWIAVGI